MTKVASEVMMSEELREKIAQELAPILAQCSTRQEKTVAAARILFFEHGITPSAKSVHSFTAHGSMGDIQSDLRGFWKAQQARMRSQLNAPSLPADLLESFGAGLDRMWQMLGERAHASFAREREEAMQMVKRADQRVLEAQDEATALRTAMGELEQKLAAEVARREQAEGRAEGLAADVSRLEAAVVEWRQQVESSEAARLAAEARFAAELEAERAERRRKDEEHEALIESHREERNFAMIQIDTARRDTQLAQDALQRERESKVVELEHYRSRLHRIENERADGLRRISELTIALQRAEDKLIAHAETERRRQLELEKTEVRPTRRIKASMTGTHRKRRILAK